MAVLQLQRDVDDCRTELELARSQTPAVTLRPPRRSGFTSTPVPRYSRKSNWEQYREVFEAVVRSNGWDDVTAALRLLSLFFGTVPGYPGGLLAVLVGVPFLFLLLFFCFKRGFYCWVIILNFSSFFIILFAVDLNFPIFVSNMSVAVIF